ncbi:MAG: Sua5/YciO/YrdC/YwlC family protein, partial [Clostridiales bacterium]|nr:Sua5/YciO/YrdC/YwlC family protein [Clostridiales bacterium]
METKILTTTEFDIALAGQIIANGGLVAFPTETVYGLGANALNEQAVKKIYIAKGRPSDNPLIVHVSKKEDIAPLVKEITPAAKKLIDRFFPGPITIILPKSNLINDTV